MNKPSSPAIESLLPAAESSTIDLLVDVNAPPSAPPKVVVLLVDDQMIVARAVRQLFTDDPDIAFHYCLSPHQALERAEALRPTVILQDLVMPDITGLELVHKYRATPATAEIPIIVLSTKEDPITKSQAFAEGANDYLVKLPDRIELVARVRYHSRAYQALTALRESNAKLRGANEQLQSAYAHLEDDLKAAAWMQANLLPSPSRHTLNITSEWRFRPSSYVGGDIFNIFPIDHERVGFYLLDVSGHGVPAAMLSVTLSMVLSPDSANGSPLKRYNAEQARYDVMSTAEAVTELNRRFQTKDDRYFTMIYGILDTPTGELTLTQAGHPGPVMMRRGFQPVVLGDGGSPVGMWPEMEYETVSATLRPGDRLVLYSDGVVECANPSGEQFGEERLMSYLSASEAEPLSSVLSGLELAMEQWRGIGSFDDDVSLLALEYGLNGLETV
jgi:sigma-B regulation protein RsbU (phosphoserine phosphatase)